MAHNLTLSGFVEAAENASKNVGSVIPSTLRALGVIAVAGVRQHFQHQQAPDGTAWPALKHPRPDGGSRILQDKGLLTASISCTVTEQDLTLQASHPGAAIHQYGGTITAKSGKYLSIPVTRESKRTGSPRRFPRPLFFIATRSATAGGVLAEAGNKKGSIIVQYVLVKSVEIPARPYLGFSAVTLAKMRVLLADRMVGAVLGPITKVQ